MIKYYFLSFEGTSNDGGKIKGCYIMPVDKSLHKIIEFIKDKNNLIDCVILCLKELSKEEYEMLTGINVNELDIIQLAREYSSEANYPFEDVTGGKLAAMDVIKFILKNYSIVHKQLT